MSESVRGLREKVGRLTDLLSHGIFLSLSAEDRQRLMDDAVQLRGRVDAVSESFLTVGLLGGTGVGKSSIMNALAGAEVSSAGHGRPHSHRVLIYSHAQALLPPPLRQIAQRENGREYWKEIRHDIDSMQQIHLCDLPDFDSLATEHREQVLKFVEHLDILVWVTSLEKYADARFYDVLSQVPKGSQNFYFVVNKIDLLFQGQSAEVGHEELTKIKECFRRHLLERGYQEPMIYGVSALYDLHSDPAWNEISAFRRDIFRRRDEKEVRAIKAANLDMEIERIVSLVAKETISLEALRSSLDDLASALEQERGEWARQGREFIRLWLESLGARGLFGQIDDLSTLIGPGHIIGAWLHERRNRSDIDEVHVISDLLREEAPILPLRRKLDGIQDRLALQTLSIGLPSSSLDRFTRAAEGRTAWEELQLRFHTLVMSRLLRRPEATFSVFRAIQRSSYVLLLLLFLLSLTGESVYSEFPGSFSLHTLILLFLKMTFAIFSPAGLCGLAGYVILNFFLGVGFYRRYKKSLQRRKQKFIETLGSELERLWEEELNTVILRLNHHGHELGTQVSALSRLKSGCWRD